MFITEYTDKIEYMNFIESMIEEQQEMEQYVNECIILSNPNKKIFNEFVAINEAKSGDKVKSFFNRLKSFFAKIWQKFIEKLNAWSQDNKKYLENYKDIILGKEVTLESVKMHDHFKGKQRIDRVINNVTKFAIPLEDGDYKDIHDKTKTSVDSSSDETTSNNYNSYLKAQYNNVFNQAGIDSNINIKDDDDLNAISSTLTTYFNGDEEQETYYKQDLQDKIKTMFNSIYTYKETFDGLNKIQETYKASMDKSEKAYDAAFSKISTMLKNSENAKDDEKEKIDEKIKSQKGEFDEALKKAKADVEKGNPDNSQTTDVKVDNNNARIKNLKKYDFLNEVEVNKSTDSSGTKSEPATIKPGGNKIDTKPSQNAANSTSTNFKNKTSDVKSNAGSNVNMANAKVKGANATDGVDTKKLDEFQSTAMSLIRAFSTSRTTVFGAMLNGLTSMRNDYMTVIRAHVQSYLGQVNDSSKNTGTTSSNPNTN